MNLGEFRLQTEGLPDDTELVIWEEGDATWYEAGCHQVVEADPINSYPVLVLESGQRVELLFDMVVRTGIDE